MAATALIDDDGFRYEALELEPEVVDVPDNDDDIATIIRGVMRSAPGSNRVGDAANVPENGAQVPRPHTETLPSVADDFIRNFLIRSGMNRTLDCFNTEWYEMKERGALPKEDALAIPDVYAQNQRLEDSVAQLRLELAQAQEVSAKAQSTWDRFRRERDFHRMHHKRVVQEKNKLVVDLKRLKTHYEQYEPTLQELRTKYELAMKEKMLMRLERDRLAARVAAIQAGSIDASTNALPGQTTSKPRGGILAPTATSKARLEERFASGPMPPVQAKALAQAAAEATALARSTRIPDSKLPTDDIVNPYLNGLTFEPARATGYKMTGSVKAHGAPVAAIAFHPTKPIFVSASDDCTWRMWAVQSASDTELMMNGEGHRAWLADAEFHPSGTSLATCSGDGIVKLWNLATASCAATLADHTQTAWDVSWHHLGDFLASASMDHTCKLWDAHTGKVRQTFRGHADSVNAVTFQPFSVYLATGSGDKTVSIWDSRSGLCIQTFYGHTNAVNDVAFNLRGDTLASADADGNVKLWDIRMVAERASISLGRQPVHSIAFDRSAQVLAAGCDDGVVRVLDTTAGSGAALAVAASLRGHEDSVQSVSFDPTSQYLVSGGSDASVRIWSEGVIKGAGLGLGQQGAFSPSSGGGAVHGGQRQQGQASPSGYPDGDD